MNVKSPINPGLLQANLEVLSANYPDLSEQILSMPERVRIKPRSDGYFSARIANDNGFYHISTHENVAEDKFDFRREIRHAIEHGADLIFLLGIGLGYRLQAAWETLEYGFEVEGGSVGVLPSLLVVLEESPELVKVACSCSDLRYVFRSSRCELICTPQLMPALEERIRKESWFGARKTVFFWGYQVADTACQPPCQTLVEKINQFMVDERERFAHQWKSWLLSKHNTLNNPPNVIVIIPSEMEDKQSALLLELQSEDESGAQFHLVNIPSGRFLSQTYLMQQIVRTNADQLVWCGVKPGSFFPSNVWESLPLSSRYIGL